MTMKNFIWNFKEKSIRGSFVNLVLTFTILFLIVAACFSDAIQARLVALSTLVVGFYATSLGVWSAKKIIEGGRTTPP